MSNDAELKDNINKYFRLSNMVQNFARTRDFFINMSTLTGALEKMTKNWKELGYPLCPCRLSQGSRELDKDYICPCKECRTCRVCHCMVFGDRRIAQDA